MFDAADLSAVAATLTAAGFTPGPVADQPWGRTFVVRDPDLRRVELKQQP